MSGEVGIFVFVVEAVAISLSGVMSPGPITAATLAAGVRRRHAGAMVALGHAAVELPLIALLLYGLKTLVEMPGFGIGVGLAGGGVLVVLGVAMVMGRGNTEAEAGGAGTGSPPVGSRGVGPFWTGIALSVGNPYFLLWWATAGLTLLTTASGLGVLAVGLFWTLHWLCDLVWLEVLSLASHRGARIFGPTGQRVVTTICAAAMAVFGLLFIGRSGWAWWVG